MGLTFILSIFRDPETSSIADLEAAQRNATVQLRTYGPYRSEYGRLAEFPHLPPLLVRKVTGFAIESCRETFGGLVERVVAENVLKLDRSNALMDDGCGMEVTLTKPMVKVLVAKRVQPMIPRHDTSGFSPASCPSGISTWFKS